MDNSLGLDVTGAVDVPSPDPPPADAQPASPPPATPASATSKPQQQQQPQGEKKVPYVNKNRVQTGGAPREKLSPEELEAKMAEIRKRNQLIKEKRELVLADEAAFKQQLAEDEAGRKARDDNTRKVQAKVNQERGQNAQRKLEKMGGREWDSAKGDDWSQARRPPPKGKKPTEELEPSPSDGNWKAAQQEQEGTQKPDKPYKHRDGVKKPRKPKKQDEWDNDNADKPEGEDAIERSESSASEDEWGQKKEKPSTQRGGKSGRGGADRGRGRGRGGKKVSNKARTRRTSASTDEDEGPTEPIAVMMPKTPPGGFKPLEVDVAQTNWAGDVIDESGW
ncbi:hypothetical protein EXIGLDRAFT_769737 [Exidia glandulosa HHB12029]|uniref:Uncharacterized protein n=1 Tax=Exidia glandulosa HHB12029 TaxID=1314781 RepID=A0A166AG81_EXIGL|nr:hypothetical protein EXIGLDRAFT_769737 [Exidia glandulosa HHB12029]